VTCSFVSTACHLPKRILQGTGQRPAWTQYGKSMCSTAPSPLCLGTQLLTATAHCSLRLPFPTISKKPNPAFRPVVCRLVGHLSVHLLLLMSHEPTPLPASYKSSATKCFSSLDIHIKHRIHLRIFDPVRKGLGSLVEFMANSICAV
jgi:hypothetical protein